MILHPITTIILSGFRGFTLFLLVGLVSYPGKAERVE